jgi:ubiquinone/menaquinone biosynthesis C-methylase UbiE
MSMTKAASEYFAQVAEEWDSMRAGYFPEAVREAALLRAYLRPEMVVADVGAGTGFVAAGLAPRVRQVYALDGSAAMLKVAQKNLSAFSNVTYQVTDGQSLPLDDGSVDAVFANMVLHHCPDPATAIVEMVRILKPGGRLMLTDLDTHPHEWMRREMADEWLGFDRAQVREWLHAAGLVNVLVDCTGSSCCAESQAPGEVDPEDRQAQISVFLATGTRRVRAREAVQAHYGAEAKGQGCGCSPQPAAQQQPCCGTTEVRPRRVRSDIGYSAAELDGVPSEAAEFSMGCGNPVLAAGLQPGETVLDIGSGGGIDAFYAARPAGPAGRVIGLDMTPEMIARAQDSAQRAGLENVSFHQGQAEAMPVEDGIVDVILSNCVINLCEDKGQVLAESYRVLKEGGRFVVSDVVTDGPLPLALRNRTDMWGDCVLGALPEQEYVDLLRQAGFGDVEVRPSNLGGTVAGVRVYSALVMARKGK